MEDKKLKGRKMALPPANSFTSCEASGWMTKLLNEGWLKKRWRKRYCILSSGILYLYERQDAGGSEKTCRSIRLNLFESCVKASRKECKKSPYTLVLDPIKTKNESAETSKNEVREFFYTESEEELEKWISKLKESISLSNIGTDSKLKHVTKSRARPPRGNGGARRPPSKQHLKERAMLSEVTIEETEAKSDPQKPRGNVPSTALKPPPLGKASSNSGKKDVDAANTSDKQSGDDQRSPRKAPIPPPAGLKPPSKKRAEVAEEVDLSSENEEIGERDDGSKSNSAETSSSQSPPQPPDSLKPSLAHSHDAAVDLKPALNGEGVGAGGNEPDNTSRSSSSYALSPANESARNTEKHQESPSKSFLEKKGQREESANGILPLGEEESEVKVSDGEKSQTNPLETTNRQDKAKSMIILDHAEENTVGELFLSEYSVGHVESSKGEKFKGKKGLGGRPSSLLL